MSLLNQAVSGFIKKPLFVMLHAPKGVGKTTFAASAPSPLFFDFEESTDSMHVTRIAPNSFDDTINTLIDIRDREVGSPEIPFKALAFDSADRMEALIHERVAEDAEKDSISEIGYKQGYIYALVYWQQFVTICKEIRDKHKMHIIILCHSMVKKIEDPILNINYDKYELKLHHKAADILTELSEMVLFARKDIAFTKNKGQDKVKTFDVDERYLHTQLSVAYDAKNRIGLPEKLLMPENGAFDILWQHYLKASGETPQQLYNQCLEAIKRVQDIELKTSMTKYVDSHKTDLNTLRLALQQILTNTKEQ